MEYFVVGSFSGFWVMVLSEVIPRLLVGILVHFQHFPKFPLEFNRTYFNPRVGTAGVKCLSQERNKVNSTQVLPWPLWVKHTIDRLFDVTIAVSYMKLYLRLSFCSHKFNEKRCLLQPTLPSYVIRIQRSGKASLFIVPVRQKNT